MNSGDLFALFFLFVSLFFTVRLVRALGDAAHFGDPDVEAILRDFVIAFVFAVIAFALKMTGGA